MPAMPTQEQFPEYAMISPTSRPLLPLPSAWDALVPSLTRKVLLIHPSSTAVFLVASLTLAEVSVCFAMDWSPLKTGPGFQVLSQIPSAASLSN